MSVLNQNGLNQKKATHEVFTEWLGRSMRVVMTDGRTLIGQFLCTDQAKNVILGSAQEYLDYDEEKANRKEPRMLGLAMIPGRHITSIQVDLDPE